MNPTDYRTEQVLAEVSRDAFVSNEVASLVTGRSIPPTESLWRLLKNLEISPDARILVIGAGSGYVPAVLSRLGREVLANEKNPVMARVASANLDAQGFTNVRVVSGEFRQEVTGAEHFDIIVVMTPSITSDQKMLALLKPGGQMLCLEKADAGRLVVVKYTVVAEGSPQRKEYGYIEFTPPRDEIFIEPGLVDKASLEKAKQASRKNNTLLLEELHRLNNLNDNKLYQSLSRQYGAPLVRAEVLLSKVEPSFFRSFSKAFLDYHHLMPLYVDKGVLQVATTNPEATLTDIQQVYPEYRIDKVLVTPNDFRRIWSALDNMGKAVEFAQPEQDFSEIVADGINGETEAKLVFIFESLLLDAVTERASDIHLEQYGEKVRVRLRIDGELNDMNYYRLTPVEFRGLVNVIKLRAELNIAERRLPQGGRARLRVGTDLYDLRVQVQPSLNAEHVVIRLLPQNTELISIDQLGLSRSLSDKYRRLLQHPAGLVLVVGPTGSGKSTTLYAGLKMLAGDGRRKVITVEDPIEFSIEGISQTRVRPEIGFNFADAMRSFVRQDPDVILVGEIRDAETAREAMRASQTGHLVLSTLHCNDAVDVMQRLYDLDVLPNSLASELLAVFAQRLARRICSHCREETEPDPAIMEELFPNRVPEGFRTFTGKGCESCEGTGIHGRIGVVEFLLLTPELRNAIAKQVPIGDLRKLALDNGLVTMRDSALDHVIAGTIPLSELPRLLPAERMAPEARWDWGRAKGE